MGFIYRENLMSLQILIILGHYFLQLCLLFLNIRVLFELTYYACDVGLYWNQYIKDSRNFVRKQYKNSTIS